MTLGCVTELVKVWLILVTQPTTCSSFFPPVVVAGPLRPRLAGLGLASSLRLFGSSSRFLLLFRYMSVMQVSGWRLVVCYTTSPGHVPMYFSLGRLIKPLTISIIIIILVYRLQRSMRHAALRRARYAVATPSATATCAFCDPGNHRNQTVNCDGFGFLKYIRMTINVTSSNLSAVSYRPII